MRAECTFHFEGDPTEDSLLACLPGWTIMRVTRTQEYIGLSTYSVPDGEAGSIKGSSHTEVYAVRYTEEVPA